MKDALENEEVEMESEAEDASDGAVSGEEEGELVTPPTPAQP